MGLLDFIAPGKKNRISETNSTQAHLRIGEIRDNVLVLKNGSMRAVIKVSSINFNLKSEQEQNAIINGYQGFINSLEFPVQILIRSKKLDIDDYIQQVKGLGEKQTNPLLREQTMEYADYVKKLVEYADIMEKAFYIVIPYDPGRVQAESFIQKFFQSFSPKDNVSEMKKRLGEFEQLKKVLAQRMNIVRSGLENCSLKTHQLTTQEIIELFYLTYNPNSARNVKMKDLESTEIEK